MKIHDTTLRANGIEFACRVAGEGPPVLCLHGFPDTHHSFDRLLPELAAAGYQAVAPSMRGYAPSSLARDRRYGVPDLAADVAGLIDALQVRRAAVIGHDWGAVATYAAAGLTPGRLACAVTLAVPPLRHLLFRPSLGQMWRSRYMAYFQLRGRAERRCLKNDMAFLRSLWQQWSPGWAFSEAEFAPLHEALGSPANMNAALRYYRALPMELFNRPARKRVLAPIRVPTLVINGEQDGCMIAATFRGLDHCFAGPWQQEEIADAGHFLHLEQPRRFADTVVPWLQRQYRS